MNKEEYKRFCTNSILKWLKSDKDTVNDYFESVYDRNSKPNYSDLLKGVRGTTLEDVSLSSVYIIRGECTTYLRKEYEKWLNEKVE